MLPNKEKIYTSTLDQALNRFPKISTHFLLLTLCCSILVFIIWAYFAKIDEITRGLGQVIPSSRVQIIQNLEGGILSEMLVHEDEIVEKDQVLLRLENTYAASQFDELYGKSLEIMGTIARLEARINKNEPKYPQEIIIQYPEIIARNNNLLVSERNKDNADLELLKTQKTLREQEVAEQEERKKQLNISLELAKKQRNMAAPLVQQKAYSSIDFMTLEQNVQNLAADLSTLEFTLPKLYTALDEADKKLAAIQAEQEANLRSEIHTLEGELTSIKEMLKSGNDRLTRTEIKSPVKGTVKAIYANTVGGVIRPAEPIMEIVPIEDDLVIEARISPQDIAFIYPGQEAIVKLTAYDFGIYGGLKGIVESISADTLSTNEGEGYYGIKIRATEKTLKTSNKELTIIPGMTAQVDILTGKKSLLDYLLKPLLKAKEQALTER